MGLLRMLESFKSCGNIETLILDTNSLGDDGAEAIAQWLAGQLHCYNNKATIRKHQHFCVYNSNRHWCTLPLNLD